MMKLYYNFTLTLHLIITKLVLPYVIKKRQTELQPLFQQSALCLVHPRRILSPKLNHVPLYIKQWIFFQHNSLHTVLFPRFFIIFTIGL